MKDKCIMWCNESKTVLFVCVDGKLALMIALADKIRPNSFSTLDWLRKLCVQSAMITGYSTRTAMAEKGKLGLDECIAEMKLRDKLSWIKALVTRSLIVISPEDVLLFMPPQQCYQIK